MTDLQILLSAASIVAGYLFVSHRISTAVQPLRLRAIEMISDARSAGDMSNHDAEVILARSSMLHSSLYAWAFAAMIPVAMIGAIMIAITGKKVGDKLTPTDKAFALWHFCVLANSPIALILAAIFFLAGVVIVGPVMLVSAAARISSGLIAGRSLLRASFSSH